MKHQSRKHILDSLKNYIQIIIQKDKISLLKYKKLTPFFRIKNLNHFMIGITSFMLNQRKMPVDLIMERGKIIEMKNFTVKWAVKVLDILNKKQGQSKHHKTIKISHNNPNSKLNGVKNYSKKSNWQEECSL